MRVAKGSLVLEEAWNSGASAVSVAATPWSARGLPVEPGDDLQVGQGGKGLGERRLGACQVLWEIEQHRPQLCRGRGLFADQHRRCDEEVGGVVPPWLERGEGLAMKADNVLDEAGGGPEAREGGVGHVAKGRHRQAERTGCGGMPGNALEDSGIGVQALTDGRRGHRARRGASAFCGQGRGGDLLGEAGKCGEVDARNSVALVCQAARQESASDDTRDVVRHQHRHGSHRIVTLDLCYRCSQGHQSRPTVRRCRHLNGQGGTPSRTPLACLIAGYRPLKDKRWLDAERMLDIRVGLVTAMSTHTRGRRPRAK